MRLSIVCAMVMVLGCIPPPPAGGPQPQPASAPAGGYGGDGYGDGTYGDGTYGDGTYGDGTYGDGTYPEGAYGDGYTGGTGGIGGAGGGDEAGTRCRSSGINDCPALSYCCITDQALQTYGCSRTCNWP